MIAVDTNVLVYVVDDSHPQKQQIAKDLIRDLHTQGTGILLWQVAVEFVAVLRRLQQHGKLSDPDVKGPLDRIRRVFPMVLPTEAVLDGAMSLAGQHSLSHWDAMLLAACIEAGVATLHTEDLSSGHKYGPVLVDNPFASVP